MWINQLFNSRFGMKFLAILSLNLVILGWTGARGYSSLRAYWSLHKDKLQLDEYPVLTNKKGTVADLQAIYADLKKKHPIYGSEWDIQRTYQAAENAGFLEIKSFEPLNSHSMDGLKILSYQLKISGSYESAVRFINILESSPQGYFVRPIELRLDRSNSLGLIKGEIRIERLANQ